MKGGKHSMSKTLGGGGGYIGLVCCAHQFPRGLWGHVPQESFGDFRPPEVISGAFHTVRMDHITGAAKALRSVEKSFC